jgi:hypothetical protein
MTLVPNVDECQALTQEKIAKSDEQKLRKIYDSVVSKSPKQPSFKNECGQSLKLLIKAKYELKNSALTLMHFCPIMLTLKRLMYRKRRHGMT